DGQATLQGDEISPGGRKSHVDQIKTTVADLIRVENPDQALEQDEERIGRIEFLALEDLGLRFHVEEVEREIFVHAGEGPAVRREQALQTGFADDDFVRLA